MSTLPVIDLSQPDDQVADQIGQACRDNGFFYLSGHGVPPELIKRLDSAARRFFDLPEHVKAEISMERGGRAWRGFFPVGGELTSGRPDLKEGVYFGREEPASGLPLRGPNLFPEQVPELGPAVLEYLEVMTRTAQRVMSGIARSLGLDPGYFSTGYTADPTVLFRVFHYPPSEPDADGWGVGEHTDYGLLTLLLQDDNAGLQVHTRDGWIEAPPIEGTFVCNIGDMLDKLTGGLYRSTPHRVRNLSGNERLSFPFFFDPGWDCEVPPLPYTPGGRARWDGQDLRAFTGTYGDYLLSKVSKVFPQLGAEVLPGESR
ncbi:isopenicillin N synthase family dioxygenase [Nonomuraea soli]|uniref:Isopenicillin N synthase-like dioxygenase n=1 Tax=Nonomuraea soli TaxID=1032476 RepID=A0A7W0CDP7_9ACTN|nr:isopenicillin N synthase family oxygenase [Nonomuraea soli]MBA2889127.1 isopenicillin N synthase-like dioxygenase [Nonomuraea soli]